MNISINIPSAQEARDAIEKGEYKKAQEQIKKIEEKIKETVSKGNTSVYFYEMEPCVKAKLEEMGYKINVGEGRNETYYRVRW